MLIHYRSYRSYRSPLSELSELTIECFGQLLPDHAKVTMDEVELNHTQMYVAATKEFLNHWRASTSLRSVIVNAAAPTVLMQTNVPNL